MFDFESPTPSDDSQYSGYEATSDRSPLAVKTTTGANRFLFPNAPPQGKVTHNIPSILPLNPRSVPRTQAFDANPKTSLAPPSKRNETGHTFPELRAELDQAFSIRDIQVPANSQTKQSLPSAIPGNPVTAPLGSTNPALYSRHKHIARPQEGHGILPSIHSLKQPDRPTARSFTDTSKSTAVPSSLPNSRAPQRNWNVATGFSYTDSTKRRLMSPAEESATLAKRPSVNQQNSSPPHLDKMKHLKGRHFKEKAAIGNLSEPKLPLSTIQQNQAISSSNTHSLTNKRQKRRALREKENSREYNDAFWFDSQY